MKLFKWLQELLFGKKDAIHSECEKVYSELEKVKNSYQINIDPVNKVEDSPSLMGTAIDYETGEPLVRERPFFNDSDVDFTLINFKTGDEFKIKSKESVNLPYGTYQYTPPINGMEVGDDPKLVLLVDPTPKNSSDIHFFSPEDNKEIKLDEKKSDEIKATKKKRQYKKKKK